MVYSPSSTADHRPPLVFGHLPEPAPVDKASVGHDHVEPTTDLRAVRDNPRHRLTVVYIYGASQDPPAFGPD